MSDTDRRAITRCPVCHGPTKPDPSSSEGVRCRTSTCAHNHAHVKCPRCGENNLETVERDGDGFAYTCDSCKARFKSAPH